MQTMPTMPEFGAPPMPNRPEVTPCYLLHAVLCTTLRTCGFKSDRGEFIEMANESRNAMNRAKCDIDDGDRAMRSVLESLVMEIDSVIEVISLMEGWHEVMQAHDLAGMFLDGRLTTG